MTRYFAPIETPFGRFAAVVDGDGAVTEFHFQAGDELAHGTVRDDSRVRHAADQVAEFFARKRETFELVLRPQGTPFQLKVWQALRGIPFGETISYQELARRAGDVKAAQAVGQANNRNPIPLIIPCHRVIGKNGAMVGFGGGLPLKRQLLDFENPPLL